MMKKEDILIEGINNYLSGDYERVIKYPYRTDGKRSKHDRCEHLMYMWEGCESCVDKHFIELLKKVNEDEKGD